jgi:hypothetical protein
MCLSIAFFFIQNYISRSLTILSLLLCFLLQFTEYLTVGLIFILLVFVLKNDKKIGEISVLTGFAIAIFIVCTAFECHHRWFPLSMRKVFEYTALNLTPLLISCINDSSISSKYLKVPQSSTPVGVSLPGFEVI